MGSKRIENVCFGFSHSLPFGISYECGTCSEQVCKMLFFSFFFFPAHGRPHGHLLTSFLAAPFYPPCWHSTLILSSLQQTVDVASTRNSLMTCLPAAFCLPRLFQCHVLSLLASGFSRCGKRSSFFLLCALSVSSTYFCHSLWVLPLNNTALKDLKGEVAVG